MPSIKDFKDVMSLWATGISVITTIDEEGKEYGFTANSFTSVSLDPMLVSFCIVSTSPTLLQIEKSQKFAISILSDLQEDIAKHFATSRQDKFKDINYKNCPETKCPYLENALGWLECTVQHQYPGGDHDIFVGEVIGLSLNPAKKPLIYFNRGYVPISEITK